MQRNLTIWLITLPLCGLLIFAMGSATAFYVVNGRYRIEIIVNPNELRLKTDVEKGNN